MAVQTATKPEGPTGDFKGDIQVDDAPPNGKMLEKVKELTVLDEDKKKHSFKSLYEGKGRILFVFIRHFFCGNCQEYTRTLSADLPPPALSALSPPTSLIIIGCGSADLIPMYKHETSAPFTVYADPTRKLYDALGMTKTLSLGDKTPQYMRQPLYRVVLKSFIQEMKSGRHMLSGGDFWQVGGEFIFEYDGTVNWCHRMKNTRDHAELEEIRKALRMGGEPETAASVAPGKPVGSRRSMSGAGLVRKLSDRRKSWRNSLSRNRFRNTEANGNVSPAALEKLKEEDNAPAGDRDAALAKLTGGANGNIDVPATGDAVLNGGAKEPVINGAASEGLANGKSEPASKGIAAKDHPYHTADQPTANGAAVKPASKGSPVELVANGSADRPTANEPAANGSANKPIANGSLRNSTLFVQSLMNGSTEKNPSAINNSAEATFDKAITKEAGVEAHGTLNGSANGTAN